MFRVHRGPWKSLCIAFCVWAPLSRVGRGASDSLLQLTHSPHCAAGRPRAHQGDPFREKAVALVILTATADLAAAGARVSRRGAAGGGAGTAPCPAAPAAPRAPAPDAPVGGAPAPRPAALAPAGPHRFRWTRSTDTSRPGDESRWTRRRRDPYPSAPPSRPTLAVWRGGSWAGRQRGWLEARSRRHPPPNFPTRTHFAARNY